MAKMRTIRTDEDAWERIENDRPFAKEIFNEVNKREIDTMERCPWGDNQEKRQIVYAMAYLHLIKRRREEYPESEWMERVNHTNPGEVFYSHNPDAPRDAIARLTGLD